MWPKGNATGVDRRSANGVSATGTVKLPRGLRPSSPSADGITRRVPCALSPQIALLKLDLLLFLAMLGATGFVVLYLGRANSFHLKPRPFFLADTSLWVCRTGVSLSIILGTFVPLSILLDMQPNIDCAILSLFYYIYVGAVFLGFSPFPHHFMFSWADHPPSSKLTLFLWLCAQCVPNPSVLFNAFQSMHTIMMTQCRFGLCMSSGI
jgi:hypothetical protein